VNPHDFLIPFTCSRRGIWLGIVPEPLPKELSDREPARPDIGPFGCGWFIKELLLGNAPYGSPMIDPGVGAPQADIFHGYKIALLDPP